MRMEVETSSSESSGSSSEAESSEESSVAEVESHKVSRITLCYTEFGGYYIGIIHCECSSSCSEWQYYTGHIWH